MTARAVPEKVTTLAWLLVAGGAADTFVTAAVVTTLLGAVGGAAGWGLALAGCSCGPALSLCALWGVALLPLGVVELACGAMVLANPDGARTFVRVGHLVQLGSGLFGGVGGVVCGLVARNLLADAEVAAFLETADTV